MGSYLRFPALSIDTARAALDGRFRLMIRLDRHPKRTRESRLGMVRS